MSQVLRALHRCFLYDTVSFLDEARFQRLLPPLIAQLGAEPPQQMLNAMADDVSSEVVPSGAANGKDDKAEQHADMDVMGRAAVGALVQMAVTAGSDAQWKPLHHQVRQRHLHLLGCTIYMLSSGPDNLVCCRC